MQLHRFTVPTSSVALTAVAVALAALAACSSPNPTGGGTVLPDTSGIGNFDGAKLDGKADTLIPDTGGADTVTSCKGTPCPDDGNPCTDELCDENDGKCKHFNNKAPCDDGDPCTSGDLCGSAKCKPGKDSCQDAVGSDGDASDSSAPGLPVGSVIITEVMYNPYGKGLVKDDQGEWIELYNPGNEAVDLGGVVVRDLGKDSFTLPPNTSIAPLGRLVIGANNDAAINGGVKIDVAWGNAITLGNTADAIILESSGSIVDAVTWQLNMGWPNLNGVSLSLSPSFTDVNENDLAEHWCGAGSVLPDGDKGTPGKPNDICLLDTDKDGVPDGSDNCPKIPNSTQLDDDLDGVGDACQGIPANCGNAKVDEAETCDDAGWKNGDGCSAWCQIELPVAVSSVVISEFISNPAKVPDDFGEWIELYNPTTQDVVLNGMVLQVGSKNPIQHVIAGPKPLVVPSKGLFLLAVSGDPSKNGGLPTPGYAYSKITMSATAATLTLKSGATVVDQVAYDSKFPLVTGKSAAVDPTSLEAGPNDDPTHWCKGQATYGLGDFGSPGTANPSCVGADQDEDKDGIPDKADNCKAIKNSDQKDVDQDLVGDACDDCKAVTNPDQADGNSNGVGDACEPPGCGNAVLEGVEVCDDGNVLPGDGCSLTCQKEATLVQGSLVISEFLANPKDVSDTTGEWVELYNPGTVEVEVAGVTLHVGTATHTIKAANGLTIKAGGFLVLGKSQDPAANGGAKVDYLYGSAISLPNSGTAEVRLFHGSDLIDEVIYTPKANGWLPMGDGASYQLATDQMNATANDLGPHWCYATQVFGPPNLATDKGTPGAPNSACSSDGDGDGLTDDKDNCPNKANVDQKDGDADGVGDLCDNCPALGNAGQQDGDGDGVGDACSLVVSAVCGNGKIETGETCDDGNSKAGDGCGATCQIEFQSGSVLKAGDLVITEIMNNPKAIDDGGGEWFEVLNTTGNPLDLQGLVVIGKTVSEKFTVDGKGKPVVVQPGALFVFGISTDSTKNGGATVHYAYGSAITLTNGNLSDVIELQSAGVSIDKVEYLLGKNGWPNPDGASLSLSADKATMAGNDVGGNWCLGTVVYGVGDKGTPAAANAKCVP